MIKKFECDFDDFEQVNKLFNQLKTRMFQLKREADGAPTRKERNREIIDACFDIYNSDISSIYGDLILSSEKKFYVYAHLDTSSKIAPGHSGITTFAATLGMSHRPFYIGKGTGNRCAEMSRSETHRKVSQKLALLGKQPAVFKIREGITESEALQLESKLIDIFGLIPQSGYLANLDEGLSPKERRGAYLSSFLKLRSINQALYGINKELISTVEIPVTLVRETAV